MYNYRLAILDNSYYIPRILNDYRNQILMWWSNINKSEIGIYKKKKAITENYSDKCIDIR